MKWMNGLTAAIVLFLVFCTGPLITDVRCASHEENVPEEAPDVNAQEDSLMPAEDAPPVGDYGYDSGEYASPEDGAYQEPLYDDDQDQYGEDAPEPDYPPEWQDNQEWQEDATRSPGYDGSDQIYMENPDGPVEEDLPPEEERSPQ